MREVAEIGLEGAEARDYPMADDPIYVRSSVDQATFRDAESSRLRNAFTPWD